MPLHKQPRSLSDITGTYIKGLLIETCLKIEKRYGSYDNPICLQQVNLVQLHLIQNIGNFLDNFSTGFQKEIKYLPLPCNLFDDRIFLGLFMYYDAKNFQHNTADRNVLSSKLWAANFEATRNIEYTEFFLDHLRFMPRVVKLDLSFVKDAHLLFHVIGDSCNMLEQLMFDSDSDCVLPSNNSLLHLCNCINLRVINNISITFPNYELDVIRNFIKLKTNLTIFNFVKIGFIITAIKDCLETPLALTSATEFFAEPEHVQALASHCPKLRRLELNNCLCPTPEETVIALLTSSLQLTHLNLNGYTIQNGIHLLLENKGVHLTSLCLVLGLENNTLQKISKSDILAIGKSCPNLTDLKLDLVYCPVTETVTTNKEANIDPDLKIFRKLKKLSLRNGVDYDDEIVNVCLKDASQIENVFLKDDTTLDWSNTGGALVTLDNPMSELQSLYIVCSRVVLTPAYVTSVYNRFSYLKCLLVTANTHCVLGTNQSVDNIQQLIKDNNYDIAFTVFVPELEEQHVPEIEEDFIDVNDFMDDLGNIFDDLGEDNGLLGDLEEHNDIIDYIDDFVNFMDEVEVENDHIYDIEGENDIIDDLVNFINDIENDFVDYQEEENDLEDYQEGENHLLDNHGNHMDDIDGENDLVVNVEVHLMNDLEENGDVDSDRQFCVLQ